MGKYKNILITGLILVILGLGFFLGRRSNKGEISQQYNNVIAARDSIKRYQVKIKSLELFVSVKNAIIMTKDEAIKAGIIERDRLKALHLKDMVANAELSATIKKQDSLLALPPKTEFITVKDSSGIKKNYVKYPFQLLNVHTEFLDLDAGLDSLKKAWYKISTPVTGEMSIGYVKDGLFKTKPVGIFTSPNPNLTINNMDILIVQEKRKWFDRWYIHALFGAAVVETGRQLLIK